MRDVSRLMSWRILARSSLVAATFFIFNVASAEPAVKLDVTHIGDATHFEFTGASEWKYKLERDSGKGVMLRVSGLKPEAIAKLRGVSDTLIKNVTVNEQAIDRSAEVIFKLAPGTDYFDYISDQPSRLIVDFFPQDEKKSLPAPVEQPAKATPKKQAIVELPPKTSQVAKAPRDDQEDDQDDDDDDDSNGGVEKKVAGRLPAADGMVIAKGVLPAPPTLAEQLSTKKDFNHGIFDGGDPEFRRFSIRDYEIKEDALVASKANFYLPFPMLELGTPQLKALLSVPPAYEVVPSDTRENKEVRVLLKFFEEKKRALFLKTANEFLSEHPTSVYDEIVRYLIADAHHDIWRASNSYQDFETAMNLYLSLSEKYPQSPMTPRTLLLIGYSYLDRGDSFGALKAFQRFSRLNPTSKHIDRVRISIAEAYFKLNRFDDAYNLLEQIEKSGTTGKGREEAAFRKGDIFFRRKDYTAATKEYRLAIQKFPVASVRFPNAFYNVAEAEFIRGKHRESLESYRSFLQKFPDHEHGGYAMTRMGELLAILGADPQRVQGAFMESHFRYRATPGAGIARIRLLTSRMPEMKDKEVASALHEINEIKVRYANRPKSPREIEKEAAEKAEAAKAELAKLPPEEAAKAAEKMAEANDPIRFIPKDGEDPTRRKPELPGIEEFSTLLIADGFTARKEFDESAKGLISYYQKNPQSPNREKLTTRIARNISDSIKAAVDRGDFIEALRRYSKNLDGWLKNTDRIDVRYNVGRAYEQAGVFTEAETIFNDCAKRLNAIKGQPTEREHTVFESLPKMESVHLRLAAVSAKAGDFSKAESHLKKIGANGARLAESEQIERAEVSAQVAEARGRPEVARKYLADLLKAWAGDQQLTSPLHLRMARLETAARNYKAADTHLAKILAWKKQEGARITDEHHAQALELRGDLMVKRGRRADAVKAYRDLLGEYETKRPLEAVRYRLGQVLYQDGDLKAAETEWNQLKPGKENLWQRLATEQMQGAKWQIEYKKYIERIPAAAELRDASRSQTR